MDTKVFISFIKKHPVGVGCALLAVVLGVLTFVRAGSLADTRVLLEERTAMGTRLKNNLRYSAGLDEHLAVVKQAMVIVESKVINPGALATNLQFFYRLEEELGLTIVDLRQKVAVKPKKPQEYIAVPYTVAVEGTYLQLVEFLQRLEEGDRVIKFLTTNVGAAQGAELQSADPYNPVLTLALNLELLGRS